MMNKENEYYVLDAADIHMVDNPDVVETRDTVRWDNDKATFICKTKVGIVDHEDFISKNSRKKKEIEMNDEMKKDKWIKKTIKL